MRMEWPEAIVAVVFIIGLTCIMCANPKNRN